MCVHVLERVLTRPGQGRRLMRGRETSTPDSAVTFRQPRTCAVSSGRPRRGRADAVVADSVADDLGEISAEKQACAPVARGCRGLCRCRLKFSTQNAPHRTAGRLLTQRTQFPSLLARFHRPVCLHLHLHLHLHLRLHPRPRPRLPSPPLVLALSPPSLERPRFVFLAAANAVGHTAVIRPPLPPIRPSTPAPPPSPRAPNPKGAASRPAGDVQAVLCR